MKRDYTELKAAFAKGLRIEFEQGSVSGAVGRGKWFPATNPCWAGNFNFRVHPEDAHKLQAPANLPYTPYADLKPGDVVVRVYSDGCLLANGTSLWPTCGRVISAIIAGEVHFSDAKSTWATCTTGPFYLKVIGPFPPLVQTPATTNARPHAEVIKAWADGITVQILCQDGWEDLGNYPVWVATREYRIKPESVAPAKKQPTAQDFENARQRRLRKHAARRVKLVNAIDTIEKQVQALDKQYKEKALRANRINTQHYVPQVPNV